MSMLSLVYNKNHDVCVKAVSKCRRDGIGSPDLFKQHVQVRRRERWKD